jgi:hypothetical protein
MLQHEQLEIAAKNHGMLDLSSNAIPTFSLSSTKDPPRVRYTIDIYMLLESILP